MVIAEQTRATSDVPQAGSAAVAFDGVAKRYGARDVLQDVSLAVAAGSLTVIYGPPAAGKSVLMRVLMGLEEPTAGRVSLRGQDVTRLPAADRNIGYIPQSFALYPHLSVRGNIAYPLKLMGIGDREAEPIIRRAAEMLDIVDLLPKRPDQLSGGQKQRVAIARGLAKQTDVYVFDDPLAGLDFKLREQLVEDLRDLQQEWGATFVYTTSDAIEALTLADQLAVLDLGTIVEHGPPAQLYADPQHQRTMALVGFPPTTFLAGRLERRGDGVWCATPLLTFPTDLGPGAAVADAAVGIRPESFEISAAEPANDAGDRLTIEGRVLLREDLGGEEIVYVDAAGTALTGVDRRHEQRDDLGARVTIGIRPRDLLLFSSATGRRVGRGVAAPVVGGATAGRHD